MAAWIEPEEQTIPDEMLELLGGESLAAQILVRRGITSIDEARGFLDPSNYVPTGGLEMPGMEAAVNRVEQALGSGQTICIWGDFDVDGQSATALLMTTLEALRPPDAPKVQYYIPNRERESHGIRVSSLEKVLDQGVNLVLTCDTGIAAHEAVAYAAGRGVDVVITDHHALAETIPPAYAVVNPQLLPSGHPLRELPGVGVAYKLAEVLLERAQKPELLPSLLELAALGIVADVAVLKNDTRYILQKGLQALRQTARPGLVEMFKRAELNQERLTEEHIGFALGPRLNALGRLSDAALGVELLTSDQWSKIKVIATEMEGLSARRQMLTTQIFDAARAQCASDPSLLAYAALVLSYPNWPAGIIGLVAGRLAELHHRPVVLITIGEDGIGRGSARSVPGVDITRAIAAQTDLLEGFGGHPMAAGLAIQEENIPAFRSRLSAQVAIQMDIAGEEPGLVVDGYLPLSALSSTMVEVLEKLSPFGPGNPPVTLVSRHLRVKTVRRIGKYDNHAMLTVEDKDHQEYKVMWWQGADLPLPEGEFDLAYTPRNTNYKGRQEIQIEWKDYRSIEEPSEKLHGMLNNILDFRGSIDPQGNISPTLAEYLRNIQDDNFLVWKEGEALTGPREVHRYQLVPVDTLVLWTKPAHPLLLAAALERAAPHTVVVVFRDPDFHQPQSFLTRLVGLLKYTVRVYDGAIKMDFLETAMAQTRNVVLASLEYLEQMGSIRFRIDNGNDVIVELASNPESPEKAQALERLTRLLEESKAYRRYLGEANLEKVFSKHV